MQDLNDKYSFGNLTDVGMVRSENQDYYGRYTGSYGELVIVCDGMGGHAGGSIASRIAVDTIARHFAELDHAYNPDDELRHAFDAGQQALMEQVAANPELTGMGTTMVILLLKDDQYWVAHCGDSRIYLKRRGVLYQLTKDHSFVQGLVDIGAITEEDAETHPKRNQIMRALGSDKYRPDVAGPNPIFRNDVFMLCSDGLYHYFSRSEIADYLASGPQQACISMVEQAKQRGGDDNLTIQVVRVNTGKTAPVIKTEPEHKYAWLITVILSIAIIFVPLILRVRAELKKNQTEPGRNSTTSSQDIVEDNKTEDDQTISENSVNEQNPQNRGTGTSVNTQQTRQTNNPPAASSGTPNPQTGLTDRSVTDKPVDEDKTVTTGGTTSSGSQGNPPGSTTDGNKANTPTPIQTENTPGSGN